jgi:hypothetical protein
MPIHLNFKLRPVNKKIRLEKFIINTDGSPSRDKWMVWNYIGIYKAKHTTSNSRISIAFRRMDGDTLLDEIKPLTIPITVMGQVRIGTVWQNSLCIAESILNENEFNIDFTDGAWSFSSFQNAIDKPYQFSKYPLKYQSDQNWYLKFPTQTSGELVIPCLEFFSRCYGRSQEIIRILSTFQWHGANDVDSKLYAPLDEPEEDGFWKVKLRKRLVNSDITILAHAKYDEYTETKLKLVYSQIEAQFEKSEKKPAFIQVAPWFQGAARLKAKGIWLDDNKTSFLALRITGVSEPQGNILVRDRDNSNKSKHPADENTPNDAWSGASVRTRSLPEIVDLTEDDPDHGASTLAIQDDDFEILGTPRQVIDRVRYKAKSKAGNLSNDGNSSKYSSGEAYGSKKGVGYVSIFADTVLESNGMLRDMWDAMLYLKGKHGDRIASVDCYTLKNGFEFSKNPYLIPLSIIKKGEILEAVTNGIKITKATRKWCHYNIQKRQMRGILVARMIVDNREIYFIEIQRLLKQTVSDGGVKKEREDDYRGFVFALNHDNDLMPWITTFIDKVRFEKGIVKNLVSLCPGDAYTFNHTSAKAEKVKCESAVKNALKKMGIKLERP